MRKQGTITMTVFIIRAFDLLKAKVKGLSVFDKPEMSRKNWKF